MLLGSKFFSFRVDHILEEFVAYGSKQKITKVFPFVNISEKHVGVPIDLRGIDAAARSPGSSVG